MADASLRVLRRSGTACPGCNQTFNLADGGPLLLGCSHTVCTLCVEALVVAAAGCCVCGAVLSSKVSNPAIVPDVYGQAPKDAL